ncbi:sodium-dependent transporter [Thermococcus sp. JCM 11816]|uniref:sodium-dependent transporter n=1 Tax=Thermococcus sp. (strain JCM 11816 / KS-1) TaxID=1295125 RepID=UPI0006CF5B62
MKRINTLMALLITGYIIGVLNYVLLPKYNIIFGLKGILIGGALVSLAVLVLIRSETESTKRTRYLPYEFMFKVSRTPGLMITFVLFLVIVAGITAYLSGWAMIFLLGQDSSFIVPLAILTILIAALLLLLAKGRTVELLAVLSVLVIVLTLVSVFLIRNEASSVIVSKQAKLYMDHVLSSMWSFDSPPLNIQGLATFFSGILLAFGLGAGVYYVIGSFSPEELNVERVLLGVFVLQLILGIAASYTVAYSLGASFQAFEDAVRNPNASPEEVFRLYREFQTLKSYTGNPSVSVHESIQAFYLIPSILLDVLPKAKLMVYSLLISLYMAGFTTVIVLIEMGAQMTAEVVQTNRRNALATVSVLSLAISLAMWNEALFKVFIFLPFSIVGILAAIEAYPSLKSLQSHEKLLTALGAAVMLVIGLGSLYYSLTGIFAMKLAAITGLILLVPVAFNSMLLGGGGRQR